MTASEISQLIENQIGSDHARKNAHGYEFHRCLVEPYLAEFENFGAPGETGMVELWVVLEENPETFDGYRIVFDEESGGCGLACHADSGLTYLGCYGSFLTTFDAM